VANPELLTRVSRRPAAASGSERLIDASTGVPLRVLSVEPLHRASLAREGIVVGAAISVERRLALGGPLIVRLGMTRIALARGVAGQIAVERLGANPLGSAR
jgi:Fe2+ transport system protein FeoA